MGVNNDLAPVDPQKVVFNYSSRVITNKQKTLLAYGLDFNLPVYKINFFQYFLKLESFADRVRKLPCNPVSFREFINKLHALSFKYFYNFKSCKIFSSIFAKADVNALKLLSTDKSIIVCNPDKGRGVVIVDKDVYVSKMCKQIKIYPST